MRQYVLTRSAFGRNVKAAENRFRLELLRRVTVPAMAAQTNRNIAWIVLVDLGDPLLKERRAAFESAGLPLSIHSSEGMVVRGGMDKPYGPWKKHLHWTDGPILTTRLDDDDAIAPWVLQAIRDAADAASPKKRIVWTLPAGYRVAGPLVQRVRWPVPMFCTLQAPPGDQATIYDINHLSAAKLGPLTPVTEEPAWIWVRHSLTRSSYVGTRLEGIDGWRQKAEPLSDEVRARFPVDWDLITSLKGP